MPAARIDDERTNEVIDGESFATALVRRQRLEPWELFERALALVLLIVAAPVLALVFAFVLVADGRPVLYRSERLGRGKRHFCMFKVRTLRRDAEQLTAQRLLDPRDGLEITGGRLLRDSRLDELPQLWNVVRGDMSLVGPRPERPLVYERHCRTIPGYARRFAIRPGLLGPSQLFTPHGTHKRIRTWIDNVWARTPRHSARSLALVAFTALVVVRKATQRSLQFVWSDVVRSRILRGYREKRRLRRVNAGAVVAHYASDAHPTAWTRVRVLDMNDEALLVVTNQRLARGAKGRVRLEVELAGNRRSRRLRTALADFVVAQQRPHGTACALVLEYRPLTPRSHYLIHQYCLGNSLASPRARVTRRVRDRVHGHPHVDLPLQPAEGMAVASAAAPRTAADTERSRFA